MSVVSSGANEPTCSIIVLIMLHSGARLKASSSNQIYQTLDLSTMAAMLHGPHGSSLLALRDDTGFWPSRIRSGAL